MISENKLQELQILEQSLNNILLQKQMFQMELSESESALREIETSKDEVFKIVGQIMIKTDKEKVNSDLLNKKKLIELRMKSLEKQEMTLASKMEEVRDELMKSQKN